MTEATVKDYMVRHAAESDSPRDLVEMAFDFLGHYFNFTEAEFRRRYISAARLSFHRAGSYDRKDPAASLLQFQGV